MLTLNRTGSLAEPRHGRTAANARVAILLSTYNGASFLRAQLDSFLGQSHADWVLHWRDDGSNDATLDIMDDFAAGPGRGRCVARHGTPAHLGPTESFLTLLRGMPDAELDAEFVAFADQDDVWMPERLARGVAALREEPETRPALYCARQVLVDSGLRRIGLSYPVRDPVGFPAALTQNVATGCTMLMNRAAARLVARSRAPLCSRHDWWCYLVVAAAGGRVAVDGTPTVLYRQHDGNLVGAPRSRPRRAAAALRRGPAVFMDVFHRQIQALLAQPHLLSPEATAQLRVIEAGLNGGVLDRLAALRLRGLRRQTWAETCLFRWWFLVG